MGLSLAMYEKATLKDGGIEQTNFDTYTPLRMSQSSRKWPSTSSPMGEKATGVGEPAVTGDRACARQRDLQRLRLLRLLVAYHRVNR